jgi:hypothetical protein
MDNRVDHSAQIKRVGASEVVNLTYLYGVPDFRSTPRLWIGGDGGNIIRIEIKGAVQSAFLVKRMPGFSEDKTNLQVDNGIGWAEQSLANTWLTGR